MPETRFIGGPHDGLALSTGLGSGFLWTDGKRCYRAPSARRALYKLVGGTRTAQVNARLYRFVGHETTLCECGVYRRKRVPCSLCGAK